MRQLIALHGGNAFATHDAFLTFLREFKIESIEYFGKKDNWKSSLQKELGSDYYVVLPIMPNKQNAQYIEWKLWFERIISFLNDDVVLVGHSLGATFLAKYLSEETFPKRIAATFLVAGVFDNEDHRTGAAFVLPPSLSKFEQQGGKIFLYHSEDDQSVPFPALQKFKDALPSATVRTFTDRQHFNQPEFPELVADIKSIP